jgi:hypothetical protein
VSRDEYTHAMRPIALQAPGEWLFAVLMAASPIVGSFWVTPDVTRWIVFGVGVAMVLGTLAAALRPVKATT